MKVLLDECLPVDFRHSFPEHEAHTAEWAGFKGRKNGHLLQSAETAGYDVLLTVDQGIRHQNPHPVGESRIVVIHSLTNRLKDLMPLAGEILRALDAIEPGETKVIPSPD